MAQVANRRLGRFPLLRRLNAVPAAPRSPDGVSLPALNAPRRGATIGVVTRRTAFRAAAIVLAAGCAAGCASVRATGPKTAIDRCVDRCDVNAERCGHPSFPASCRIEYDFCVVQCDGTTTRG
jgi:hypothetical protein